MPYKDPDKRRECARVRAAAWRAKNPERARDIQRRYKTRHCPPPFPCITCHKPLPPERQRKPGYCDKACKSVVHNARIRANRANNLERYRAADKRRDPEKKHARDRRSRLRNLDKRRASSRAWQRDNPDKRRPIARNYAHRRRTRLSGATTKFVSATVIYKRDGGKCGICGKDVPEAVASLDHIVPISRGGGHTPSNVRITHRKCNYRRGNRTAAQIYLL